MILTRETEYIHDSRLDTDLYQFLMLNFIFHTFIKEGDLQGQMPEVTYELTHRVNKKGEKLPLAKHIPEAELRKQLDHVQQLNFRPDEIEYLGSLPGSDNRPFFKLEFLQWLSNLKMSPYTLETVGDDYKLQFKGPWAESLLWETFGMNTITELLTENLLADPETVLKAEAEGQKNLLENLKKIAENAYLYVLEFGTRRRASRNWQAHVLKEFIGVMATADNPRPVKTSNVQFARLFNLESSGTQAHQIYIDMAAVLAKLDDAMGLLLSQQEVVKRWWDLYGFDFSIWLPDTYTTEAFLALLEPEIAKKSKGFRQDSGDPDAFAVKIETYLREDCGLTPEEIKKKVIVFSDGLTVDKAIAIWERWHDTFTIAFGIGTSLTNDLGEWGSTESIVIKPAEVKCADGRVVPVIKLSDEPAKITGQTGAKERFIQLVQQTIAFATKRKADQASHKQLPTTSSN